MSHKDENLQITRQTYEQIAAVYAERNQDRSALEEEIAKVYFSSSEPGGWVVDVGCGPGFDAAVFQQHNFKTIALDYAHAMMQAGRSELGIQANFVQGDMRYLPFAAQRMDGLWVSASLLHLKRIDVPPTIKQFCNILREGGILYLAVKQGEGDEWTALSYDQNVPRYFTYWQEANLDALINEAGFTIVDGWLSEGRAKCIVRLARKIEKKA